jgi:hypothetical protein
MLRCVEENAKEELKKKKVAKHARWTALKNIASQLLLLSALKIKAVI